MSHKIQTLSGYIHEYQKSVLQPEEFWARVAESFHWKKPWDKTLEWDFAGPDVKWFTNGKLNITENILDRHLFTKGDDTAIIWEPNDPNEENRTITFRELYEMTCQFSNALKAKGIEKGDRVIIYMPMMPEAAVAMLACATLGDAHPIVFAGYSSTSLSDRPNACDVNMILHAHANFPRPQHIPLTHVHKTALHNITSVKHAII